MTLITRFSSPTDAEIQTASGASPLRPAFVMARSMMASISASELTSPKYPQAEPNDPSLSYSASIETASSQTKALL